ncbi:unnamed protein product [Leptidea sinapis]|uniref:Chitin-binding type-2 domain-containing protein n=1 Tax=Leptidea sinapis TaxID=189913 RepID=A0A5E4QR57_9NEOP|nr:unnamed protein product [Leptidea sinapis]
MWKYIIIAFSTMTAAQFDNSPWSIMLPVPGNPGNDYPTLDTIPKTSFSCAGKSPGYYADPQANCQVFRVCTAGSTYGFKSFLCPNGTLFNQAVFVCDWWMNVNCRRTPELFHNNNDKFANIKFGPQLMKDVKKMITYPMRNPYNKANVKGDLITMQKYKPPSIQYFPNGALISSHQNNDFNAPNNLKNEKHELNSFNDLNFGASTTPPQKPSSSAINQETKKTQYENFFNHVSQSNTFQNYNIRGQKQLELQHKNFNSRFRSANTQSNNKQHIIHQTKPLQQIRQADLTKQTEFESKKLNILPRTPLSQVNTEVKHNLDLVFSFLAESLNAARQYGNIATQSTSLTQASTEQQELKQAEAQTISSDINRHTSSQFSSNNNLSHNIRQSTSKLQQQPEITNHNSQNNLLNRPNIPKAQKLQKGSTPLQPINAKYYQPTSTQNSNTLNRFKSEPTQIYSGQLYQLPVPVVTREYYNSPNRCTDCKSTRKLETIDQNKISSYTQFQKPSDADVEISRSQVILSNMNRIQSPDSIDIQKNSPDYDLISPENGITAHVQDSITGTLPHPSKSDKLLTYKKNQSYYLYSQISDDSENNQLNEQTSTNNEVQFVPSVRFKLTNENDKQRIINTYRINKDDFNNGDEYRNPIPGENRNTVDSSLSVPQFNKIRLGKVSTLYNGPSSYNAPQKTAVNNKQGKQFWNSRIEDFDTEVSGYPRISPQPPFIS